MAATAMAEEAKSGPKFEFHGFIGGSLFAQDAVFNGYGQQIFHLTKQPNQDKIILGGDARQTRLNFSLAGPTVFGGAVPKGVVELDFFSALSNTTLVTSVTPTGNPVTSVATTTTTTGPVAVTPRLRLSYAELNWGSTIFRMGQDNDLVNGTFGVTSVGHIPQTYAYSAGQLGTRHLDAEVFQTLPVGDMKLELALQVQSSIQLANTDVFNGQMSSAESSGLPGLESRIRLVVPKMLDVFVAGHWNSIDRNGQNNATNIALSRGDKQQIVAGQVGAKITAGPLTLQGQGYVGKNLSFETAGLGQTVGVNQGDVHEWGAWGQLGFNVTPQFSAWAFLGTEKDNYKDAIANFNTVLAAGTAATAANSARLQNVTFAGMLRYMDGGYALGLEWVHMHTKYGRPLNDAKVGSTSASLTNRAELDGNQLMLSGMYFF
jgi:hypothetical protein